jgi:hypothetical protein
MIIINPRFGVGLLQARRGDVGLASEALRASILLDPEGDHICGARLKLACLLKLSGDLEGATEALRSFQRALDNRACSCHIIGVPASSPSDDVASKMKKKQNENGTNGCLILGVPDIQWIDDRVERELNEAGCCPSCTGKHTTYGWSENGGDTGELKRQLLIEVGHVLEIKGDWAGARASYEAALVPHCSTSSLSSSSSSLSSSSTSPISAALVAQCDSPPLLQQLGWLLHTRFADLAGATEMLIRATSLPQGAKDWRGWFLLGRLYMAHGDLPGQHPKYHEAYRAFEMVSC